MGDAQTARIRTTDKLGNTHYIHYNHGDWCCTSSSGAPCSFFYAGIASKSATEFSFALKDCKTDYQVLATVKQFVHRDVKVEQVLVSVSTAEVDARAKIGAQLAQELIASFGEDRLKRITAALDKADSAFWDAFAAEFPEITTGDLPADAQQAWDAATKAVAVEWIRANTRTAIVLPGAKPGQSKKTDRAADVYEHCQAIGDWQPSFDYPGFIAWRDPLYGEVFATPGFDSPNKISVQMNYQGDRAGDAIALTCLELDWDGTAADYIAKVTKYLLDDVMRLAAMDAIKNEPCVTDYAHDVVDDLFKDAKYALAEYVSTRGGHVADYVWLEEHMGDKMKGCRHPGAYHGGLAMAVAFLKDRYPGIVANIGYYHEADVPSDKWWDEIPVVHFATFRTEIDGKFIVESVEVPHYSEFAGKVYDAKLPNPLTPHAAWDKLKDLP